MLDRLYPSWRILKGQTPGERFQNYYKNRQQSPVTPLSRALLLGCGVLIIIAGLFFLLTPAPGLLTLCIGVAMIARESLWMARFLDGLEVQLRRSSAAGLELWRHNTLSIKLRNFRLAISRFTNRFRAETIK